MNTQARTLPAGVALCRACARRYGLAVPDIVGALQVAEPGLAILVVDDLCEGPGTLASTLRGRSPERLVVGACATGEALAEIRQAASRAGIDPFGLEVVDLALGVDDTGEPCPERAVAQLIARVGRARAYTGVQVENLKLALPGMDEPVSRRGLFSLLRPRQQVVPAVDASACAGAETCHLCVSSCPYEAIGVSGARVAIDTFRCTGCGVCLPACPDAAIRYPSHSPAQTSAEVQDLLAVSRKDDAAPLEGAPVLLYKCQCAGKLSLPSGYLLVEVPCLAMLPVDLLLLPFEQGAAGVMLAAGACPRAGAAQAWAGRVGCAQATLDAFGAGASRIGVWRRHAGEAAGQVLRRFQKALGALGPHRLAEAQAPPHQDGGLPGLLGRWDKRLTTTVRRSTSDASPLGVVTVDRQACTFCGICASHCPTAALTFEEKDGRAALAFAHRRCVACERCVASCPEKALALERAIDLDRLDAAPQVIAQDTLARCRSCGASLLPESIQRYVQARLTGPLSDKAREGLCPTCRIKAQLVGQMQGKGVS
ncbi:MAG: 4Fe-4S binding protein [Chloroflexi bacterium]|nr:4Fe-4S binding protein [Chloroflexota bacterium]